MNLKDVEDAAPAYGMSPQMEARFARKPLECEQLSLSYQRLAPGYRVPFGHKHAGQEEVYVALRGSGTLEADGERYELSPEHIVRVGSSVKRKVTPGPDGLRLLALGATPGKAYDTGGTL